jgi:O-antigen/teichoic acid export membrane protein
MERVEAVAVVVRRTRASTVARNVASNYAAVVWMGALSLAVIPIYVRTLGAAEWGVVAACMTLQGFLIFLDVGFGQIMPRSFARVAGDRAREADLFRAYSRIYGVLAAAGFVAGQLAATPAARHWFQAPGVDQGRLELALHLIPFQFVFQFANNAHVGLWNGLQLQHRANLRACVFASLRHAGALAAVFLYSRTAFGYLVPFVLGTFVEWLLNRRAIRAAYAGVTGPVGQPANVRDLVREAGGFAVAVILGLLLSQSDRFVLSATQDLRQFGYYVIVANVGLAFMNLQGPLLRAFLPKIVREDAAGRAAGGHAVRLLFWSVFALSVLPTALVIVAAPSLLTLWIRNPEIVEVGTLPLRLILAAVAVNALYNVIYVRLLSRGESRVVIAINVAGLLAVATTVLLAGTGGGIAMGGVIWVVGAVTQLTLGLVWLARQRRTAAG